MGQFDHCGDRVVENMQVLIGPLLRNRLNASQIGKNPRLLTIQRRGLIKSSDDAGLEIS